jgi:nitrogen fixation/metabolism regulation signal transduction histidine kinase
MKHEARVMAAAAIGPLPAVAVALVLLWTVTDYASVTKSLLTATVLIVWLGAVMVVHERVVFPLRTLSNMLAALREQDFSMRLRGARGDDAMGEVLIEVNALGNVLREQRLGAIEATALLRRVMAETGVAVFAFDADQRLRLLNRHAEQLLGKTADQLLASSAASIGLAECLEGDTPRIVSLDFPGGHGRWELRRGTFYEGGATRQLLLLSDLTRTLREEERQAWQRLVHVLRHEVNNSLAPIHSIADSLTKLLAEPRPAGWDTDLREGLAIISDRSNSLNRFMSGYARLTRLQKPQLREMNVGEWVRRVVALETRMPIAVVDGPESLMIQADRDQLDQLLINLLKNAVEAVQETGGKVEIGWRAVDGARPLCEVWIDDEGPGISNSANLFVPFYTTKPTGTGIGLVLSRQIAEAHGGQLMLENRDSARGCRATCQLPRDASA